MIIEVGMLFGLYVARRNYGLKKQKNPTSDSSEKNDTELLAVDVIQHDHIAAGKNADSGTVVAPVKRKKWAAIFKDEKSTDHYLKVSTVSLGLSFVRQFVFPFIAPVYLLMVAYQKHESFVLAEKSLKEHKQVDFHVYAAIVNVVALGASQYFALGISGFMFALSGKLITLGKRKTEGLLVDSLGSLNKKVWCLKQGVEIEVDLETLEKGDVIVVNVGSMIPVDGIVVDGKAMVDQHTLTGESQPAEKETPDKVFATTMVIAGKLMIEVERAGKETTAANIDETIMGLADFKSEIQQKGERWSDQGGLVFLGLAGVAGMTSGVSSALAVLTSHLGGRLRVLAPLGTLGHLKIAANNGIVVKSAHALECVNTIDTILFDKTGTLTDKTLTVNQVLLEGDCTEETLFTYAAAAECKMDHPIAQAILEHAEAMQLTLPEINESEYQIGYGVSVMIGDCSIRVGSFRFISSSGMPLSATMTAALDAAQSVGNSMIFVAENENVIGAIELTASVRPETREMIAQLRTYGVKYIAIVSGDQEQPTRQLAADLELDGYFYDVLPDEKAGIVEQLQSDGKQVCFVGDGVNDAIALQKADVSVSLTGASSIATNVADIILIDGSLDRLAALFDLSEQLQKNLQTSFNILLVPAVINVTGALFFQMGFITALILKQLVFVVGVGNALRPLTTAQDAIKLPAAGKPALPAASDSIDSYVVRPDENCLGTSTSSSATDTAGRNA